MLVATALPLFVGSPTFGEEAPNLVHALSRVINPNTGEPTQTALFTNYNDRTALEIDSASLVGRSDAGRGPAQKIFPIAPLMLINQRLFVDLAALAAATSGGLPVGGLIGQWLRKSGPGDFEAMWAALGKADIGLDQVDNTSDASKPISTAVSAALAAKLSASIYTAADVLAKMLTVDGAGSGLDADTLDGNEATVFERIANKAIANGYASLDATGKVPTAQLPASVIGGVAFQGTWNATTNAPTIPAAAAANKGFYYRVAVGGSTNVDGVADWQIGDWIISDGTIWSKIDNTDQVMSVAGKQGNVTLNSGDLTDGGATGRSIFQGATLAAVKTILAMVAADIGDSGATGRALLQSATAAVAKTALALVKGDVGLGSVDNTSDASKPVSTATQTALDSKLDSATYTAANVLAKMLTVDGAGSGLDADLLDGFNSTAFELIANKAIANGYASLDSSGKVPTAQLPASLVGSVAFQSTWNASTNTPAIPAASSANKGFYYRVATAGATNVDGITDWKVGDWIISEGTAWSKIDNTDQVTSVAGKTGVVTIQTTDITDAGGVGRILMQAISNTAAKTQLQLENVNNTSDNLKGLSQEDLQVIGGCCYLKYSSPTALQLLPLLHNVMGGNRATSTNLLKLVIPDAGVAFSNSGLVANTLYYIYARWSGIGTGIVLEGYGTVPVYSNGYPGYPGNTNYTCVGMALTNASAQFQDRCTLSFYNRRRKSFSLGTSNVSTTSTTSTIVAGPLGICNWGDESVNATWYGQGGFDGGYGLVECCWDAVNQAHGAIQFIYGPTGSLNYPLNVGGEAMRAEGYHSYYGQLSRDSLNGTSIGMSNSMITVSTMG